MERTFTITEPRRTALAVLLCTVSGFFGAVALQKGATPTSVTFWMWFVWGQTADWVDCRHWLFHRAGRVMWHKTMGQIYEAAKEGQLPTVVSSPVSRIIHLGATILLLATIACFFVS
jgi:hypothetical protein